MHRLLSSVLFLTFLVPTAMAHQWYEVRSYILGSDGDADVVQRYLESALLPALQRQSVGPVGLFTSADTDESDSPRFVVVIPLESADDLVTIADSLGDDAAYREAAAEYLDRPAGDPPYQRIESELLHAMDCMPKLQVPADMMDNPQRVYELRVYESANERIGNLKVDMFNNGEVPIFLASGIAPVFIGQTVVGPQMPSLTYLTAYENEQQRGEAWDAFRSHPDWLVLKEEPKYKNTVSRIDKYVLRPLAASQM